MSTPPEPPTPWSLSDSIEILERTPAVLSALLGALSGGWTHHEPEPGWWSARTVLAHLVAGELTDWIPRLRMILEEGESRAFPPFDREGAKGKSEESSVDDLLAEFKRLRSANIAELRASDASSRPGARGLHPTFGPVTLAQLVATWAVHDLNHLGQISEALAKRYRDEIGPWRPFLPIVNRPMEDSG